MVNFKEYFNYQEFETTKLEFKEQVNHKNYETWAKTVTAFANSEGGSIFFGVDDNTNIVGSNKEN